MKGIYIKLGSQGIQYVPVVAIAAVNHGIRQENSQAGGSPFAGSGLQSLPTVKHFLGLLPKRPDQFRSKRYYLQGPGRRWPKRHGHMRLWFLRSTWRKPSRQTRGK